MKKRLSGALLFAAAFFLAIQGWNAAGVYQSAIAIIGKQIDK